MVLIGKYLLIYLSHFTAELADHLSPINNPMMAPRRALAALPTLGFEVLFEISIS